MSAKPRKQPIVMFGLGQRCCYWKQEGPYYCGEFGPGDEALLDAVDMAGNQSLKAFGVQALESDAARTARAAALPTTFEAYRPPAIFEKAFWREHRKATERTITSTTRVFRGGNFGFFANFETELVDLRLAVTQTSESSVETVSSVDDATALTSATPLVFSQFTETLNVVIDSPFNRIAPRYPQPEAVWQVPTLRLHFYNEDGDNVEPDGSRVRDQHFSSMGVMGYVALPVLSSATVGTCDEGSGKGRPIRLVMEARRTTAGPIPIVKNPAATETDAWELGVRREFSIVATGVTRLQFATEGMIGPGYPVSNVEIDAAAVADFETAARAFWSSEVSPTLASYYANAKQAFAKLTGQVYYCPGVWTNDVWAPYPDDPIAAEVRARLNGAGL